MTTYADIETNILVREEPRSNFAQMTSPTTAKITEIPGISTTWSHALVANTVPIFKAVVIITLFLLDGIGFSPLGCKTQFLMTPRFWYNKQIVIFLIIYFIINLGGKTVSQLTDPIKQLVLSVICLLIYNIVARLGDIWWNPSPWYFPGPMSWFTMVALPLIAVYVLDDMRRYYIAENAAYMHRDKIDILKRIELVLVGVSSVIAVIGFVKAMLRAKKRHGGNFSYLSFFFGAPMALAGVKAGSVWQHCTDKSFQKFRREISKGRSPNASGSTMVQILTTVVGLILLTLGIGYIALFKGDLDAKWNFFKTKQRNMRASGQEQSASEHEEFTRGEAQVTAGGRRPKSDPARQGAVVSPYVHPASGVLGEVTKPQSHWFF